MSDLFDEILAILTKYRINAIYKIEDSYYTKDEAEQLQKQKLKSYLSNYFNYKSVALYGGGGYCNWLWTTLESLYGNFTCIIDNFPSESRIKKEITVLNLDEFLKTKEKNTDAVIITSWNYHEAFKEELKLVKVQGDIIDIPAWLKTHFPDFSRPVYEYNDRLDYIQINQLEVHYHQIEEYGIEKYTILKKIIYALCMIKDFLYAEKYINEMKQYFFEYGESQNYQCAIKEIKRKIEQCAKKKGKDVLFIHVIDSLADWMVDHMPWLCTEKVNDIRIKGVTVQYPCTHYAMNTMFTGKTAFEIEKTTENIEWTDSELLTFIKENYSLNIVSGNGHIMQQFKAVNENANQVYPYITLTEALFEGIAIWGKNNYKNIILLHSCGELHSSFFRVGSNFKLISCENMKDKSQFQLQFEEAICYTDEELEWYDSFYAMTEMPMVIMGDHGGFIEAEYNYFLGVKKDVTRGMNELITSGFIIKRIREDQDSIEICTLIPNTRIPQILLMILQKRTEMIDELGTDTVELEFPPGYDINYCKKFMSRGIWGQYEGFIGLKTKNEIYLVSASGRELYYRPNEWGYRNLSENDTYEKELIKCRKKMENRKFPIDMFKMEKYKNHLELLSIYDKACFRNINRKMHLYE